LQKTPVTIIIAKRMENTYGMKKYSPDKIALLALFVLALLIARFITASRSAIVLTDPIELEHTGLSVSMPAGNGWRTNRPWTYQQNSYTLTSNFIPVSGSINAHAGCRYHLAAAQTEPQLIFEQKAASVDGIITETGQLRTDTLTVDWAHIKKPQTLPSIFLGTVQLSNSRRLDIEVFQATGDTSLAEQTFRAIVKSLKFQSNELLQTGGQMLDEIKNIGLNHFLKVNPAKISQNAPVFFLIKNASGQNAGFTMDVLTSSDRSMQFNIEAASFSYFRGRYPRERRTLFQSNNTLNEFIWKSQNASLDDRSVATIVLARTGLMTVSKLNPLTEEKYQLSPAAIPKILLELLFTQMLDSGNEKLIVDIVEADGIITPALVSKTTEMENGRYVLKAQLLNGRGLYYELTGIENILKQFPERADYILQKNKLLEQNQF
jgi:hypothetical protein